MCHYSLQVSTCCNQASSQHAAVGTLWAYLCLKQTWGKDGSVNWEKFKSTGTGLMDGHSTISSPSTQNTCNPT